MILSKKTIIPHKGQTSQHSAWISEAIWGHRIERQPAPGLLLEFLSMAEALFRQGRLLDHEPHDTLYTPYRCTQLRNILFNNPSIQEIAEEERVDEAAWDRWLKTMHASAVANQDHLRNYEYLKDRFDNFEQFASIVALVRKVAMDAESSRGWPYRLLYPIGPAAIYDEVTLKPDKSGFTRTRVLFTRTGELAYMMLSRADKKLRLEISEYLTDAFLPTSPKNRLLLRLMSGNEPDLAEEKSGSYLPYIDHPAYERLAEDVAALFRLGLPEADAFSHLGPLLAFHLLLYQLETANAVLQQDGIPSIVCEILAPRSGLIRRASVGSISDNESLGVRAIDRFVNDSLKQDSDISDMMSRSDLDETTKADIFKDRATALFFLKRDRGWSGHTVEDLKQEVLLFSRKNYQKTVGDATRSLGDQCGLRSKLRTNRYRYAPSDLFLRNLVYVTVSKPIKESDFLHNLYNRYRLVIGPEEGRIVVREELYDKAEFEKNRERLLMRLMAMGLARRMSDSFSYVINPIAENHAH